jgi:hypothetical protein
MAERESKGEAICALSGLSFSPNESATCANCPHLLEFTHPGYGRKQPCVFPAQIFRK